LKPAAACRRVVPAIGPVAIDEKPHRNNSKADCRKPKL
jgi:hypothetical protein